MSNFNTQQQAGIAIAAVGGALGAYLFVSRSGDGGKRAPMVPSYIPWMGSALAIGKDPDGFVSRNTEKYGDMFAVKLMGKVVHYVTSPSLIDAVYKQSHIFDFEPIRLGYFDSVFKIPREVGHSKGMSEVNGLSHKLLGPAQVKPMIELYTHYAFKSVLALKPQLLSKGKSSLKDIIHEPIFEASTCAFFGPTFPVAEVYPVLRTFDKGVPMLAAGLPEMFIPETVRARNELYRIFGEYLAGPKRPCELLVHVEQIAKRENWPPLVMAQFFFGMIWPVTNDVPYAVFWLIALQLRRPEKLSELVAEIDQARESWAAANPGKDFNAETDFLSFYKSASLPLLESAIQEVYRYTTSSYSVRQVMQPVELTAEVGETYSLSKGDTVMCITRSVHLDEDIYENADQYLPKRFMKANKYTKKGKEVPNYLMGFGGGASICEGRHFATAEIKIYIILLLSHLRVEPDPESLLHAEFDMSKVGFGVIRNTGDVGVLVQARA